MNLFQILSTESAHLVVLKFPSNHSECVVDEVVVYVNLQLVYYIYTQLLWYIVYGGIWWYMVVVYVNLRLLLVLVGHIYSQL